MESERIVEVGPSSAWWCEAASHESDHRPPDHGFGMRGQTLVVAVEAAPAIEPSKVRCPSGFRTISSTIRQRCFTQATSWPA